MIPTTTINRGYWVLLQIGKGQCNNFSCVYYSFVQWQLETMLQDFLPRLGGEISAIGNNPRDPSVLVVACNTNRLKVVNLATMSVTSTIQGVSPNPIRNLQFITSRPTELHLQRARSLDLVRYDSKTGYDIYFVHSAMPSEDFPY